MFKQITSAFLPIIFLLIGGCSTAAPMSPELLALSADLRENPRVAAGFDFVLAVKDGKVYGWGTNRAVLIDEKGNIPSWDRPVVIPIPEEIISVSAASERALALTKGGEVWTWGNNYSGNLPIVQQATDRERKFRSSAVWRVAPFKLDTPLEFTKVSASASRNIALTTTGEVWVWGSFNAIEEIGKNAIPNPPYLLDVGERVKDIGSGVGAFYLKTESDRDLVVSKSFNFNTIRSVKAGNESISEIDIDDCSISSLLIGFTALAICSSGDIYVAGDNIAGSLGIRRVKKTSKFIKNEKLSNVLKVTGGTTFIALTRNGKVYGWGDNSYGVIELANSFVKRKPFKIQVRHKIVDISSKGFNAFLITEEGDVLRWVVKENWFISNLYYFFGRYYFEPLKDNTGQDFKVF